MFLNPTAKPVPRSDALAVGRVPGAAGEADRVARELLRRGRLERGGAADHLGGRQRARDHLAGRQRVPGGERVQQPELDRVDAERGRELVHLRLGGEAGLNGAEAPHRAARRVVRVDAGGLDQRVRDVVRPAGERGCIRGDGGRGGRVRSAVEQDPHPHADEAPLLRRAVLGPDLRRVAVHVADERLLAAVDELDRPVRVQREHRAVDLHRQVLAPAERPAHAAEVEPHLLRLEAEAGSDLVTIDV